jgi:hypothetical protein
MKTPEEKERAKAANAKAAKVIVLILLVLAVVITGVRMFAGVSINPFKERCTEYNVGSMESCPRPFEK